MIKYRDFCVQCDHCIGFSCIYSRKLPVHCCDECGDEIDDVYEVEGEELCEYCLHKRFKKKL